MFLDHLQTEDFIYQQLELAIQQGKGWAPGEKEAYLEKILDDDFIPPLFCSTQEELEKTGLKDAFSSLIYDGEVSSLPKKTFIRRPILSSPL